jgi:hypothetical protein
MRRPGRGNNQEAANLEADDDDTADIRRRHQWRRGMSVIDFFEYLVASEQTVDLAHDLADVWVARQLVDVFEPAA